MLSQVGSGVYVFFFQAEDGIRDYKVTGVQTCALPICGYLAAFREGSVSFHPGFEGSFEILDVPLAPGENLLVAEADRKSTRLNSSHLVISYAVFCLKKKKKKIQRAIQQNYMTVEAKFY